MEEEKSISNRILIMASICITILMTFSSTALAARVVLFLPGYEQQGTGWCWAASDKMIIQYIKSSSPSQQSLVNNYSTDPDGGASMSVARTALNDYGVANSIKNDLLTYTAVNSQINNNRPLFCRLQNGDGWLLNHAVVIKGYDTSTNFVIYIDPSDGLGHGITYSRFCDGVKYDGAYSKWNGTIYNNRSI